MWTKVGRKYMYIDDPAFWGYMSRENDIELIVEKLAPIPIHMINISTVYNVMRSLGLNPDSFTSSEIEEILIKRRNF